MSFKEATIRIEDYQSNHKTVAPLLRLLMEVPFESLLLFLHQLKFQWSITRRKNGDYYAVIFQEGMVKYQCVQPNSARAALCNALARFLSSEARDFHHFTGGGLE